MGEDVNGVPPQREGSPADVFAKIREVIPIISERWAVADADPDSTQIQPMIEAGGYSLSAGLMIANLAVVVLQDPQLPPEVRKFVEDQILQYDAILRMASKVLIPTADAIRSKKPQILLPGQGGSFKPRILPK